MTMLYAIVSMTKKCHNHTLQTNPRHHEEEAKNDNRNMTFRILHDCKTIKDTRFIITKQESNTKSPPPRKNGSNNKQ